MNKETGPIWFKKEKEEANYLFRIKAIRIGYETVIGITHIVYFAKGPHAEEFDEISCDY